MITPDSMGRASTFFNTMRQVGSATGVAILSTVLIGVGSAKRLGRDGHARHDRLPPRVLGLRGLRARRRGLLPHHPRQRRRRDDRAAPQAGAPVPRPPPSRFPRAAWRDAPCASVCSAGRAPGPTPPSPMPPRQSGSGLAARGVGLVYGGASVGLMGVVADAAIAAGGRATGVITESLAGHEIAHGALSDLHVVTNDARAQGPDVLTVRRLRHAAGRLWHLRGVHGVRDLGPARASTTSGAASSTSTASSTTC